MAKNTKQIALIQHRRGKLSELPKQLNEGELALSLDTNDVFIGNPNNPILEERLNADEPKFPYGNIQILTEFTDNMNKIEYTFHINGGTVNLPIIATGTIGYPTVATGTSLKINDTEIIFSGSSDTVNLNEAIALINNANLSVKANNSNGFLQLITNDATLTLENGVIIEGKQGAIEAFGFNATSFYASHPNGRPLQDVLDDRTSIKNFDAYGNGITNDYTSIYNAILMMFGEGKEKTSKDLFFPAGTYIVDSLDSLLLITNTHLSGEGMGRTIIKATENSSPLMTTGDATYTPATSENYDNSKGPTNILVRDMTLDISESAITNLILLGSSSYVTFRNVEFIGRESSRLISTPAVSSLSNITFENCIFKSNTMSENGIQVNGNMEHLLVKNCNFKNLTNAAILFPSTTEDKLIINCLIDGNRFENCGTVSNSVISYGNKTQFVNVVNSLFDKDVIEQTGTIKPYTGKGELDYIDTLDPNTDNRKILKFKFTQPMWDYLDYFVNPNGEYLIKSIYSTDILGTIPTLTNSLEIKQGDNTNNNTFTMQTTKLDGDYSIGVSKYANLYLGTNSISYNIWEYDVEYKKDDIVEYNVLNGETINDNRVILYKANQDNTATTENAPGASQSVWTLVGVYNTAIILNKDLDLHSFAIKNELENGDIRFETTNNIIKIDDNDEENPYEYRIAKYDNAIPNVAYVDRVAQPVLREKFDFNAISSAGTSKIELINFDPTIYGDFIYFKKMSLNVRRPFYEIIPQIQATPIEWKTGYKWYAGEVVKYNDNGTIYYYACTKDHISNDWTTDVEVLLLWEKVSLTGIEKSTGLEKQLKDIKYVSLLASNGVDNDRLIFSKESIDVARRDINANYYDTWVAGHDYVEGDMVSYNNRYWRCMSNNTSVDVYDLHTPSKWISLAETGYNYIFDFERNLFSVDPITGEVLPDTDYILEYNFSGYKIYLEMYDENGNLLPVLEDDSGEITTIPWEANKAYTIGEYVTYSGKTYYVNANFTSGQTFETIIDGNEVLLEMENEETVDTKVQVSPAGAMLLSLDYMRGNN